MIGAKFSPILEEIEEALWEFEANVERPTNFTNTGFRAATKIFMTSLMDKMWIKQEREEMSIDERADMAQAARDAVRKLIIDFTDIDMREEYKKEKE